MNIAAIVGILPLISQEVQLIDGLNNFFNFDHNIILVDTSIDINQFISNGKYPKSLYCFNSTSNNISVLQSLTEIRTKNNFMIVVPGSFQAFSRNTNLLNRINEIQRLDINMKIGMFFPQYAAMEDLQKLFKWCKDSLMAYVFAATYTQPKPIEASTGGGFLQIFTFHPFGTFDVKEVTNSDTYEELFPGLDFNFNKHEFRVTPYPTIWEKELWLDVLTLMNATGLETENEHDIKTTVELAAEGKIRVYPVSFISYRIFVPAAEPYAGFQAYLQAMASDSFFGYSLGVIAAITLTLSTIRYIEQKCFDIFENSVDVLNLLINDNSCIKYQQLSRAEICIIGPLTFVGFIFITGILSILQSYVTQPVYHPQIRTLEDIYNSQLVIACKGSARNRVFEAVTYSSRNKDWKDKVIELESRVFSRHLHTINTTMAYASTHFDHNALLNVQKRLGVRGFYKNGIQIFNGFNVYRIHERFLFFDRRNEIFGWLQSAGIVQKTIENVFSSGEKTVRRVYLENSVKIEYSANFEFPLSIGYGWLASVIMCAIEIIWHKCTISWLKRKSKKVKQDLDFQ